MSRGDFGSSRPGGGLSSGMYGRNSDTEYVRLSNTVSNNIDTFTRKINVVDVTLTKTGRSLFTAAICFNLPFSFPMIFSDHSKPQGIVASIQTMVNQIGTSQDVPELFDRLQNEQKESNRIAKELADQLKQLNVLETTNPSEARQRKIQKEKFQTNFSNALLNFQKVQRLAADKERQSVQRARAKSMEFNAFPHARDTDQMNDRSGQMQIQGEAELDIEMIREREEALRQLESNIVDVNDIFKELALLVHEQGEIVDSIEANVDTAAVNVETANVQLEKAKSYQKAARKKMCCVLVIVLIAAGALALIIWLAVKKG